MYGTIFINTFCKTNSSMFWFINYMEPWGLLCYDDQGMNENYQTIMTGLVSRLYLSPIEREFLRLGLKLPWQVRVLFIRILDLFWLKSLNTVYDCNRLGIFISMPKTENRVLNFACSSANWTIILQTLQNYNSIQVIFLDYYNTRLKLIVTGV